ncbi:hypothetical protein PV08_03861 [Exophiala spinifera]|uniref:C-factor n=1 Tax=Exophiala spinifera TaxID=91928 RepID=A0A0D2BCG9_9EURO|nr:uncharacterized protein PV08_03861 [Exophiala spinifera]KIW16673.1 hypothetical protein PV08_03861 [Exophiala spinifera]
MAWALVTPSSRGIGFALTRHLLRTLPASVPVVATARSNVSETKEKILSSLDVSGDQAARLDVRECDVLSESSIARLAQQCKEEYNDRARNKAAHLRLAFVIPGMLVPEKAPDKVDYDAALQTVKMNLIAPMMLVKHFSQFLPRKSATIVEHDGDDDDDGGNDSVDGTGGGGGDGRRRRSRRLLPRSAVLALMSARVGSIGDNRLGGWYSYRASKAGLNQFVKSTDIYLKMQSAENAMCVGLHPGTVKTSLSEEFWQSTPKEKLFSPEFSAERLIDVVVNHLKEDGRGKCWDWDGKEIPP